MESFIYIAKPLLQLPQSLWVNLQIALEYPSFSHCGKLS